MSIHDDEICLKSHLYYEFNIVSYKINITDATGLLHPDSGEHGRPKCLHYFSEWCGSLNVAVEFYLLNSSANIVEHQAIPAKNCNDTQECLCSCLQKSKPQQ